MTKKIIKKSIVILLIALIIICIVQLPSKAADFKLSSSKTTMNIGDTATLTATAEGCGGKFTISSSDPSVVSIVDNKTDKSNISPWIENENYSVTIKANKEGTATLKLIADDVANSTTQAAEKIEGEKSIKITVKKVADNSSATLKSITVAGKTYNNPSTDFTITVGKDVGSIEISAVATNSKDTITGTGKKDIKVGTNTITLTVKSSDGASKSYYIRVKKPSSGNSEPNTPNVPDSTPEPTNKTNETNKELRLSYLVIDEVELNPKFDPDIFEYDAYVTNVNNIEVLATANRDEAEIDITGNTDLKEGENEVLIKLTHGDEETEYKITVNKAVMVINEPEETSTDTEKSGITPGKIIMAVAAIVIVIGVVAYAIIKSKSNRGSARRYSGRHSSFDDFDD